MGRDYQLWGVDCTPNYPIEFISEFLTVGTCRPNDNPLNSLMNLGFLGNSGEMGGGGYIQGGKLTYSLDYGELEEKGVPQKPPHY